MCFQDRTEERGKSLIRLDIYLKCFTLDIDAFELARAKNFVLDIPEEDQRPTKEFRIEKKSFALACHTTMPSESNFKNNTNAE
jgi:hypothetical protein